MSGSAKDSQAVLLISSVVAGFDGETATCSPCIRESETGGGRGKGCGFLLKEILNSFSFGGRV